jgi:hypothetical protein
MAKSTKTKKPKRKHRRSSLPERDLQTDGLAAD